MAPFGIEVQSVDPGIGCREEAGFVKIGVDHATQKIIQVDRLRVAGYFYVAESEKGEIGGNRSFGAVGYICAYGAGRRYVRKFH